MGKQQYKVIRPLGAIEQYQSALHLLNLYVGTSVACRYVGPALSSPSDGKAPAWLVKAIGQVAQEQPFMRAGLFGENSSKPRWVELESIDVASHIEYINVDPTDDTSEFLRRLTTKALDEKFTSLETRPGWRILALRRQASDGTFFLDVNLAWNHANMDGMSGKIFHEALLRHLNTSAPADSEHNDSEKQIDDAIPLSIDPKRFPPPQEVIIKPKVSACFLVEEGWAQLRPPCFVPSKQALLEASWAPVRTTDTATHYRDVEIDTTTLSPLLKKCREHGATLTSLLHALILASLAKQLPESAASAFRSMTAITTRRYAHTPEPTSPDAKPSKFAWFKPDETMANYVSRMTHIFAQPAVADIRTALASTKGVDDSDGSPEAAPAKDSKTAPLPEALLETVWRTASDVRAETQAKLDEGVKNDILGLMKFVPDWRSTLRDRSGKPRECSWSVTNLGVMNGAAPAGPWSIEKAQFRLSSEVIGPALMVSPISVKGKGLVIAVGWQGSVVDEAIGEGVAAHLQAWLEQLGEAQ